MCRLSHKPMQRHAALILLGSACFAGAAVPPVPRQFTMQGVATGYSSPVSIDVKFYDASTGGTTLFSEAFSSVTLTSDGVFSITAGSNTIGGIPDSAFAGTEIWVELTFNTTDVWPRTQLLSVPFAFKSLYAEKLVKHDSMDPVLSVEPDGSVRSTFRLKAPIFASTSPFVIEAPAGTERARIDDTTGFVGINTATPAYRLHVVTSEPSGRAVAGFSTSTSGLNYGGYFETAGTAARGVAGFATATTGISSGVYGTTASDTDGRGVRGVASSTAGTGTSTGVWGESACGEGYGVKGLATATTGDNIGVYGRTDSWSGKGVFGEATYNGTAITYGVYGLTHGDSGAGVYGEASGTSTFSSGVTGVSDSPYGKGVFGHTTATTGITHGVEGLNSGTDGAGVYGAAVNTSGTSNGVSGEAHSQNGCGVYGLNTTGGAGGTAILGENGGTGSMVIIGHAKGSTGSSIGVWGWNDGTDGARGVLGSCEKTFGQNYGVYGYSQSSSGVGVFGFGTAGNGSNYGVYGITNNNSGWGGYFDRLDADYASATVKAFTIDHPLDPENRYLRHSSVESPEMMNIYNGNAELDENGEAVVDLPEYFESLNRDFRYQLTALGAPMPGLYIAQEVQHHQFTLAGGAPGGRVSWQVTGVRQDPAANLLRVQVESDKPENERGKYLVPKAYHQPPELGIHYRPALENVAEQQNARTQGQGS